MFQICPCALVLPLTLAALTLALGKQTLSAAVSTEWNYKITGRTGMAVQALNVLASWTQGYPLFVCDRTDRDRR